ncbi:MAG: hypothetical protein FJ267_06085 [Planctomycetes bacterium]|nr:hypothetical protein [Planctomycetota bacterium]
MFTPNDRSNDEASTLGIPESISTYAAKKENTASDDGSESEASDTPALTGEKSPSPSDESESEVIRARTKAPMAPVEEGPRSTPGKSTLRLDNRVISAAVAPRDRQKIAIGFQNPVATKKKANPAAKWSTKDRSTDLAQHR